MNLFLIKIQQDPMLYYYMVRKNKKELKWREKEKKIKKESERKQIQSQQKQDTVRDESNNDHHNNVQDKGASEIDVLQEKQNEKLQQQNKVQKQKQIEDENNIVELNQNQKNQRVILNKNVISKQLVELLNNEEIYQREEQVIRIEEFIKSPTQHLMYVSGISGTGKTTTITTTFIKLGVWHKLINCISQNVDQVFCKKISDICDEFINQGSTVPALIIDECDFLINLNKVIWTIRQSKSKFKIVFICNNSCIAQIKLSEPISTLLFLPYTQEQLIKIASSKCKHIFASIPSQVVIEGAKKAIRKSGDFRQMQKYITNWVKYQENQTKQIYEKLCDPMIKIFESYILRCSYKKMQVLMNVIEIQQKKQSEIKKKKSIMECICKQNLLQNTLMKFQNCIGSNECLMFVKQWQDAGILSFFKKKCFYHDKEITNIDFGLKVNKNLLKDLIKKHYYTAVI